MTSEKLSEACDRLLHPNDQEEGYAWANAASDRIAVATELKARLAADEQQAERIATLERQRDEARKMYSDLRWCVGYAIPVDERKRFPDKHEWQKGGA